MLLEPTKIQPVNKELTIEWYHDSQIVVFTLLVPSNDATDVLMKNLHKISSDWDIEKPFLMLVDATALGVTPYFLRHAPQLGMLNPKLRGHYAIALPAQTITNAMTMMFRQVFRFIKNPEAKGLLFDNRESALAWLAKEVEITVPINA